MLSRSAEPGLRYQLENSYEIGRPSPETSLPPTSALDRGLSLPAQSQPMESHPEIRSVVTLTSAHVHKIYMSGPLIRRVERLPDGHRPIKDEGWRDVWAQLGGTTLSIWDMKEIEEASKQGKEVPPTYINVTDAFVHVLGVVTIPASETAPAQKYNNVVTVNTAGSNLLLFSCPSSASLISWTAALRLAAWEKSRLEEIYTAHLIRITLNDGRTAPSTLVQGRREGWVRIRIAGQTDWKHLWMVVTSGPTQEASSGPPQPTPPDPPQHKRRISFFGRDNNQLQPPSTEPLLTFYLSPKRKDRKQPFLILRDVTQAFAVYPERPELIKKSTLMKIEGTIGDEEVAMAMRKQVGWILIMPEIETGVPQAKETIQWLIAIHDAFLLYGRPRAYSWDPRDEASMMYAYPTGPTRDSLFLQRELAENMDPRTYHTSAIRSHLLNTLSLHIQAQNVAPKPGSSVKEEDSIEGMKKLIVEEVKVRPEARSNQSRQSRDDIVASPIRDGRPIDGTTSGHYGGQTPQQGGVSAGRRPASPVIDDRVPGVKSEMEDAHVGNKVQIINDQLDHVYRIHLRERFLQWLSPSDPSTNHNVACGANHNGTAQWFFQDSIYNEWKSSGSFLWVRGKPGSGKSVLCSSIIQDITALRDAGRASMAYFYFDYRNVDKQGLHNLLPSLLCQLSAQSDLFFNLLSRLYSAHNHGTQQPDDRAMMECLKEMFTLEAQEPIYIIMDALDECPETFTIPAPREDVLEFVDELVGLQLPNLHICVTSRPEPDIQAVFEPLTARPVSLHDESGQQQDIANYVTSFVHSNERMRGWPEADKEFVIKILLEKADGMFSWVFCQLDVLQHTLPSGIRRVLEELPESLDETYERILREIRMPNQEYARRLLHCLAATVRPLRVEELEVLAIHFNTEGIPKLNPNRRWEDQEETVMSACSSLVIIVKDGDSRVVRFSHSSIKQFLTSNRLAEPLRDVSHYHIRHTQLEATHTVLAQACLGILLQFDDRVDHENIEGFPLARYAAQYWATHARVGGASSRIKDSVECLFDTEKPYFSTWLWIYNEDRGGRSMSTIGPTKPEAVPLYYAARLGFQDLVEHLIAEYPYHVNARGGREMTPMHAAASGGHTNILRLLQGHGADVGSRNKYGETPLHGASWSGKLDAGQCLLDLGADVNARNEDDWTPLFHAVFHGHTEIARMLVKSEAVIDARSVFGSSALHAAVRGGGIQTVRLLLQYGADVNARDSRGRTPCQCKSTLGQEVVELLAEYGAEFGNISKRSRSALMSSPNDGSLIISHSHPTGTRFSGADAGIMADSSRKALRKPDFADNPEAQEQKEHRLLGRGLAEVGREIRSRTASRIKTKDLISRYRPPIVKDVRLTSVADSTSSSQAPTPALLQTANPVGRSGNPGESSSVRNFTPGNHQLSPVGGLVLCPNPKCNTTYSARGRRPAGYGGQGSPVDSLPPCPPCPVCGFSQRT